jgi:hypothetical protein
VSLAAVAVTPRRTGSSLTRLALHPRHGRVSTCSHACLEPWGAGSARILHALATEPHYRFNGFFPCHALPKVWPNGDGRFDFCPPCPSCAPYIPPLFGPCRVTDPFRPFADTLPAVLLPITPSPLLRYNLQDRLDPISGCCPLSNVAVMPSTPVCPHPGLYLALSAKQLDSRHTLALHVASGPCLGTQHQ